MNRLLTGIGVSYRPRALNVPASAPMAKRPVEGRYSGSRLKR
jgi:hypothetical protein